MLTDYLSAFDLISDVQSDYLVYKSATEGYSDLEVYCCCSNSEIQFIVDENNFKAEIEASIVLRDPDGKTISEQFKRYEFSVDNFKQTLETRAIHILKFGFSILPGNYQVYISLRDVITGQVKNSTMDIRIPDFSNVPLALSSLKLSNRQNKQWPNVRHIFSFRQSRVLLFYEGYYDTNIKESNIETVYEILDSDGNPLNSFRESVRPLSVRQGYALNFSVAALPPDTYTLKVTQKCKGQTATSSTTFSVLQSPIDLSFKSYEQALDEISLLASAEEMEKLEEIPVHLQQQALNDFWKKRDPDPTTDINELMLEYYRRIEIANRTFSSVAGIGYKSDPGMIYIVFGTPDLIVNFPPNGRDGARQVWRYKKLNLRFTFDAQNSRQAFCLRDRNYVYAKYLNK